MTDPISARLRSSLFKSPITAEAADHIDAQAAKIKALVEALEWQSGIIDKSITKNKVDEHRLLLEGKYHKGPVVDWIHAVLTGFSKINRAALAAAKEPT